MVPPPDTSRYRYTAPLYIKGTLIEKEAASLIGEMGV
jgi:hypothetical protein